MAGWLASDCPLPYRRPWVGEHAPSYFCTGCILMISCPTLIPPAAGTSRPLRQEKTLALTQALQCCAERSGSTDWSPMWHVVWELQKCMAPLMSLNGDDIVETILLEPTGKELETSSHPGGGSLPHLGRNMSHQRPHEAAAGILPGIPGDSQSWGNHQGD